MRHGQAETDKPGMLPRFFACAAALLVLLGVISTVFYYQELENERRQVLAEEAHNLRIHATSIAFNLKQLGYSLLFLADQVRLHQPFRDAEGRRIFADDMVSFLNTTELFDQLRLLDLSGMEVGRANYNNGHPALVPDSELQNKSDRYYFRATVRLGSRDVYISPLDLNVEHGHVEQPFKPTIRFGMPVFDQHGHKVGVLVLNYLARHLLDMLGGRGTGDSNIMMLNREGYWLVGPGPEYEWGFMLPERSKFNLARRSPKMWQHIMANESGRFDDDGKLYAFLTIYPFRDLATIPMLHLSGDPERYFWKLLSVYPAGIIKRRSARTRNSIVLWSLFIGILLVAVAGLYARASSKRQEYERQLRFLAQHDALTRLPNRALFVDRLEQALALARRHQGVFAVLYLDLDGFKPVNDAYGHDVGDALLQEVAKRLQGCVRAADTVARMGGDEFAMILTELESRKDAGLVAGKIIAVLATPLEINGHVCKVSGSIGIACYPDDGENGDRLVSRADEAMYLAKRGGKNQYRFSSG